MIEWIIHWSIRYRWPVVIAALGLALAGWYAVKDTPVDAIPDLSENQVIVFTPWPGHAPHEVEDQITFPLSARLRGIDGVVTVRGNSELHFSAIHVVFADSVGVEDARRRVQTRLADVVNLPAGVRPEMAPEAPATGQIFWYALVAPALDLAQLRSLQETVIKPQLETIPGVAEVASVGGFQREYRIEVDPDKLAAHRVGWMDLRRSLEALGASPGAHVVARGATEMVVRAEPLLKVSRGESDPRAIEDLLRRTLIPTGNASHHVALGELARVSVGPAPRRGAFEMDGVETVGGVVMMRYGGNPLEITRQLEHRIEQVEAALPHGVTILTVYDRERLIHGALRTVSRTLIEAMVTAALCVVFVLLHFRTSLAIVLTLPLTVLGSFFLLWCLRSIGFVDARTNIMSLAGLVISIGVLVDASVVMAENVAHTLRGQFGDRPVTGNVSHLVTQACKSVGRPMFFSVLIMLLSFFPVFALQGMEGKMFRPLALTKSLALATTAVLAITAVPAFCTIFVRGRLRKDEDSWLMRSALDVYRPVLAYLLERPAALSVILGVTFILGLAPLGSPLAAKLTLALALAFAGLLTHTWRGRTAAWGALVVAAFLAQQYVRPLVWERLPPLDEGAAMDMPITVPRVSISRAVDDLKMRDMMLCRFPEVEMAMGKVGRADTATDPAPIEMIETMVMFRPHELWPRRKLRRDDADRQAASIHSELVRRGIITANEITPAEWREAVDRALFRFDAQLREYCYHRNQQHMRDADVALRAVTAQRLIECLEAAGLLARSPGLGDSAKVAAVVSHGKSGVKHRPPPRELRRMVGSMVAEAKQIGLVRQDVDVLAQPPGSAARAANLFRSLFGEDPETIHSAVTRDALQEYDRLWQRHKAALDRELVDRGAGVFTRLVVEELLERAAITNDEVRRHFADLKEARSSRRSASSSGGGHQHHATAPDVRRSPSLDALYDAWSRSFAASLVLHASDRAELGGFGGEMDTALQMPGWTNVWTRPIQNRVDMLSTGINTDIGICVMGEDLDEVIATSQQVARVIDQVPGARQVIADPIRGKPYLSVKIQEQKAAQLGIPLAEVQTTMQMALGGSIVASTLEGRERHAVRLTLAASSRDVVEELRATPLLTERADRDRPSPTLGDVAELIYEEGPTSIKSENGLLRNYVRLNVAGRDPRKFIEDAREAIADHIDMPQGVLLRWTGQYEYQQQSQRQLAVLLPIVLALIFGLLLWTYHDVADALLVLLALPGALAGGLFLQWLTGTNLSVTVLVGYIACFGMAASTGIIMLVYLREAVDRSGGLDNITLEELKAAVMAGAVQRLRPKLLTEATTIIAIAPMLWATGIGSEVIRPMAAPVLGGILIADEVIDLFLPVAFYWVRRRRWRRLHPDASGCAAADARETTVSEPMPAAQEGLPV